MNENCEQCGGKCKSPYIGIKYKNAKHFNHYWHIAEKYKKENIKPICCDSCCKKRDDLKFVEEPFLAEIYQAHFKIWMCEYCHEQSCMDI